MAWTPISNTVPQYEEDGVAASGFYIKFYEAGTTTPTAMATDSTGATLLDKCELNTEGYPKNGSNAVFIPHIDRRYKIALFRNATDADNNNLNNAVWPVDTLTPVLTGIIGPALDEIPLNSDLRVNTISDLRLVEPIVDGQQISLLGHTLAGLGGGKFYYDASDTTSLDNNGTVIVTTGGKRWKRPEGVADVQEFGVIGDGVADDDTAFATALAAGVTLTSTGLVIPVSSNKTLTASLIFNASEIKSASGITMTATNLEGLEISGIKLNKVEVTLQNSSDLRVRNNHSIDSPGQAFGIFGSTNFELSDNTVDSCTEMGFKVEGSGTNGPILDGVISGNKISLSGDNGILVRGFSDRVEGVKIFGNVISFAGNHGIRANIGDGATNTTNFRDVIITGNSIYGFGYHASKGGYGIRCSNNKGGRNKGIVIANNSIATVEDTGDVGQLAYLYLGQCDGAILEGNTCRISEEASAVSPNTYGVLIDSCNQSMITNNVLEDCSVYSGGSPIPSAIILNGSNYCTVSGNYISNPGSLALAAAGIAMRTGGNHLIEGNVILDDRDSPLMTFGIIESYDGGGSRSHTNKFVNNRISGAISQDCTWHSGTTIHEHLYGGGYGVPADVQNSSTVGYLQLVTAFNFGNKGNKPRSAPASLTKWDFTGVSTSGEVALYLFGFTEFGTPIIKRSVDDGVFPTSFNHKTPAFSEEIQVPIGTIEIPDGYTGGSLAGFYIGVF